MFEQEYGDWSAHFRSYNNGSLSYKNIEVVLDDTYTHAIVYNLTRLPKPLPKENVIGFITEPYSTYNLVNHQAYAKEHIGTYFCHDNTNLDRSVFKNGQPFLGTMCGWGQMTPWRPKPKTMSIIASNKGYFRGHQLRHALIKKILGSDLSIDIYGRGLEGLYTGDARVKGTIEDKSIAFLDYKFTIAIENELYPCWLTEKYTDPVMKSCIPIYWGATEVNALFSQNCHIELPRNYNIESIFESVKNIYHNHHNFGGHNIEEGQRIIRERQNLPEFLWKHFNHVS